MYTKVLIAEDQDATHIGIATILKEIIPTIEKAKYCDEAHTKLRGAFNKKEPFQVLITDLEFEEGYRGRDITSGEELIKAAKAIFPEIKVIVISVEKGVGRIKKLFDEYTINAFVAKGRDESLHIKKALQTIYQNKIYCTPKIEQLLRNVDDLDEIGEDDIKILTLLSKGMSQKEISENLIPSCSLSSVEKNISKLKILLSAKNPVQLISIAKDRGII